MMTTRKKILLIACALSTNVCFADNVVSNAARGAGDAIGSFAGAAAHAFLKESLPSSEIVAAETVIGDDFKVEAKDSDRTKQTSIDIELDEADIQFVMANTRIDGDAIMIMENCTGGCIQAIQNILIKTGGKGFGAVYANAIVEGRVFMQSLNSPNSEQSQIRIHVKN